MFGIRYNVTVTFSQAFRQFRLICGLVDVWALESSSFFLRQFAMRNQNYGGSLAGLAPQRSPPTDPNEPSSPIMALMTGSYQTPESCAEDIFLVGSSSLMAGSTSSLMANPANPLHSGLRGLGLFLILNRLMKKCNRQANKKQTQRTSCNHVHMRELNA